MPGPSWVINPSYGLVGARASAVVREVRERERERRIWRAVAY
jgi:hypothetical protein